jgi:AcrR family transcriptional regulator
MQTRRRGSNLTSAVYAAVLAELAESSVEDVTFERIAARAGAGKASLYKRWATTDEIILASMEDAEQRAPELHHEPTGDLRTDLVAILTGFATSLGEVRGRALWPVMAQREKHQDLYDKARALLMLPRQALLRNAFQQAAERGDIDRAAITSRLLSTGPRFLILEHADKGRVSPRDVEALIDEIILPAAQREGTRQSCTESIPTNT